MRKWVLWLLAAAIVMLSSYIYRINRSPALFGFKQNAIQKSETEKRVFRLYYFFSIRDCSPCLESIEIIKKYSKTFEVIGVIPESEMNEIEFIKREYRIDFKIVSVKKYMKFKPVYSPSIIGVDSTGKIFFVIPSVPGQYEYLESFFIKFLERYNLINQ